MNTKRQTAGKTAKKQAVWYGAKLDEVHKARITRWRKHAEEFTRLTPADYKTHWAYVDVVKTAELVAEAEGLNVVDYIVSRLIKSRIVTKKNASPAQKYHAEMDDDYERYSTRTRNAHEKDLVASAFHNISFGLPKSLRFFPQREMKILMSRFYRKGDGCMCPVVMRAMRHASDNL